MITPDVRHEGFFQRNQPPLDYPLMEGPFSVALFEYHPFYGFYGSDR
jgi:hypothetical protein